MKNCPLPRFLEKKTALEQSSVNFFCSGSSANFLLVSSQQVSLCIRVSLRNSVSSRKICRYYHWYQIPIFGGFSCTWWVSGQFFTLIDRNNIFLDDVTNISIEPKRVTVVCHVSSTQQRFANWRLLSSHVQLVSPNALTSNSETSLSFDHVSCRRFVVATCWTWILTTCMVRFQSATQFLQIQCPQRRLSRKVSRFPDDVYSIVSMVTTVMLVSLCGGDNVTELATGYSVRWFQTSAPASLVLHFFPPLPDLPFASFPFPEEFDCLWFCCCSGLASIRSKRNWLASSRATTSSIRSLSNCAMRRLDRSMNFSHCHSFLDCVVRDPIFWTCVWGPVCFQTFFC